MNTTKQPRFNYTSNAWQGAMYNADLSINDIAQRVRFFLKKQYPKCRFSITIKKYSGGQSMDICLMSAPFEVLTDLQNHNGHIGVNHYYINDTQNLTDAGKEIMNIAFKAANVYNFNDSDAMIDYFHTNFYLHLAVGRWNKPFTVKE